MSVEYTIDIQLTELGYPDILQTSIRESPDDSFSPGHAPTSLSTAQVQRLLVRGQQQQQPAAGKEAGAARQTTAAPTENPARGPQDERAAKDAAATLGSTAPEPGATDLLAPEQGDHGKEDADAGNAAPEGSTEKQDEEEVSDDSEVSDVYDEEEEDEEEVEEEEEEERPSDESSHSGGYRCCVCDQQLPSKFKLQDHMNLHTGARPYSCAECGKRFCQIYSYRAHLRTHAQTKVELFRCRVCLQYFESQKKLKTHLSRTHFEKEFYECDRCKRVFTSLKACEYHVRFPKCRADVLCEMCGRSFSTPKSLLRHRKLACHRSFKCTDCPKSFPKKNALLKHSFSHLGLLPYTCVRCRCHYRLAKLYRKHKCEPERIHCVACLRAFVSQEDFQRHKKDTGCWGNQEPKGDEIRCLECGERFDTAEELKRHAGAHQRVLKCAECGKGFRSALLLMSHMGGHAGNSPCLCQSCGLGFPHQQNYDSHLKTCGQAAPPASAPKKRPASKRLNAKPAAVPAANPAGPGKASQTPGPAAGGGASAGPGQPDGLWKLTLNEQPPPGVNLVVFFPVCAGQTDGAAPTSAAPPPDPNRPLSGNAAPGALAAEGPSSLAAGIKRDPQWEAPLDLSNKSSSSAPGLGGAPPPAIKSEAGKCEISGEAPSTDGAEFRNIYRKVVVETSLGEADADTKGKRVKVDPMDLSCGPVVKKEPQSAGPALGPWSSRCCLPTEKEIKMEVDVAEEK